MIMRITWGKLRAGSWKEFEKTYHATVATKGRHIQGLRGRWPICRPMSRATSTDKSLRLLFSPSSSVITRPIAVRSSTCNRGDGEPSGPAYLGTTEIVASHRGPPRCAGG